MKEAMKCWRERVAGLGPIGRGVRYPVKMRREAVKLCWAFQSQGGKVERCAAMLGLPASTLWTWLSRDAKGSARSPLVPVTVVDEAPGALLQLHVGAAHAAVSVEQLADLVRRLS